MSKHNYYHNYQNYQKNVNQAQTQPSVQIEPEIEEVVVEESYVEPEEAMAVAPEEVEEVIEKSTPVAESVKPLMGVVYGCSKLNVRANPDAGSKIVGVITEGSAVEINESESTADFYSVCTEAGLEGYCMKKFITDNLLDSSRS